MTATAPNLPTTPAEHLAALADACERGSRVPGLTGDWFLAALAAYKRGLPLEQSLGLSGPRARLSRDESLRNAAHLLAPRQGSREQAKALSAAVEHFEARILPRIGKRTLSAYQIELRRAFECNCLVPRSIPQLQEILERKLSED